MQVVDDGDVAGAVAAGGQQAPRPLLVEDRLRRQQIDHHLEVAPVGDLVSLNGCAARVVIDHNHAVALPIHPID